MARCDCGRVHIREWRNIYRGRSPYCRSCAISVQRRTHNESRPLTRTPEYTAWSSMRERCLCTTHRSYHRYGGRGITVCLRWRRSYALFLKDMGRRPTPAHSLDRLDNNRGYSKANCRWATKTEQSRNCHTNVRLTLDGQTMCIKEWSKLVTVKLCTIYYRIAHGWSVRAALSCAPVKGRPSQLRVIRRSA